MNLRPASSPSFVVASLVSSLALVSGCASSPAARTTLTSAAVPGPKAPGRVYRLVFVVQKHAPNVADVSSTYLMNVQEGRGDELSVGAQMPLDGHARTDTGVKISGYYDLAGDDLVFHGGLELSSMEPGQVLRRVRAEGDAVLSPGKPSLLATVEDPSTQVRYDVTVTATRQR